MCTHDNPASQTGNARGLNVKIEDSISISELSEKCQVLLIENSKLKEEIRALKARLVIAEARYSGDEIPGNTSESEIIAPQAAGVSPPGMSKNADEGEKIKLFMSLFKGRDDVYARRWENKKKGTSGYSPSCLNEWKPGLCVKPKGTCTGCTHKAYADLDEKVIDAHLRGKIVAGIYPMLPDETCWFLAIDFDDGEWKKDISVLREVCAEFDIPVVIERSRSGNGGHAWLFFKRPILHPWPGNSAHPYLPTPCRTGMRSLSNHTTDFSPIRTRCPRAVWGI